MSAATHTTPPSEVTALASELRLAVARLARRMRQEGVSAGDDVSPSRLVALATIEARGPITLGELAAAERVRPPTMTRIVASLADQGFLIRETQAQDRRMVRVRISAEGRRLLDDSRTRRDAFLARRIATLTADERDLLRRMLPALERLLDTE